MAGPGIAITVYGDDSGVEAMLDALDTALNPIALVGFLGGVVDPYLRGRAKARFASEGDDVSGKWAPLGEATQAIREQMGYGAAHPINRREGDLEAYITQQDAAVHPNPLGATLSLPGRGGGPDMHDKMVAAQQGGTGPSGKPFPARPVIGMNAQDLIFVLTALAEHVNSANKIAGSTNVGPGKITYRGGA
jgi:hypothetical protein